MDTVTTRVEWRQIAWLMCVWTGVAITGGCLIAVAIGWANAPSWGSVRGDVTSASVETVETTRRGFGSRGRSYRDIQYEPEISYRYQVDGQVYHGDGIGDGGDYRYETRDGALAALAPYTRGPLTVYYDRSNPERSALDTAMWSRLGLYVAGFGLLLTLVGLALRGIWATVDETPGNDAPPPDDASGFAQQR